LEAGTASSKTQVAAEEIAAATKLGDHHELLHLFRGSCFGKVHRNTTKVPQKVHKEKKEEE